MNFKIGFTIIITMIVFGGCGERTTHKDNAIDVISINPHEAREYVNLSEIADSIICIRLQPIPGDVMGRIGQVVVRKKYIYAWDISQNMIFVFDKTGKFVSKLNKKGEGPDEYLLLGYMFIDDNEEYIEFIDRLRDTKLKYANISFELVEAVPLPDIRHNACRRGGGFYYFAAQQMDNVINGEKTNAELVVLDDKNNMKTLFDKNIKTNNRYFSPNSESFTQNDQNEFFVSIMYDNTFYRLEAGEAYPVFTIDFGKYGINNKVVGSRSTEVQMVYIKDMDGLASFPVLNINNSNIMSFSYYFKQEAGREMFREKDIRQYIKIKDKAYHVNKIRNDLTKFPDRLYISSYLFGCIHDVWYEDYLVDVIVPNFYFSDDEKIFVEGLGELTADSDPVVVMMKMGKPL
jgi:hypothetical protein